MRKRREGDGGGDTGAEPEDRSGGDGKTGRGGRRTALGTDRRRAIAWLWSLLGLAALGEAVWVTLAFLGPRRRDSDLRSIVVAGAAEDFEPGSVTALPAGGFYLARLDDGGFLALHRECPHLGCTVPWSAQQQRFSCPCHASAFDIKGQVLSPPAPRPLDLLLLRIENGIVKVDTGRRIRRGEFRPSQVVRV